MSRKAFDTDISYSTSNPLALPPVTVSTRVSSGSATRCARLATSRYRSHHDNARIMPQTAHTYTQLIHVLPLPRESQTHVCGSRTSRESGYGKPDWRVSGKNTIALYLAISYQRMSSVLLSLIPKMLRYRLMLHLPRRCFLQGVFLELTGDHVLVQRDHLYLGV